MAGNFTYSYVFQKNIAYAVSRANFLTYLTAMMSLNQLYRGLEEDTVVRHSSNLTRDTRNCNTSAGLVRR